MKIVFLGHGNMVRAIVDGMIKKGFESKDIYILNPRNPEGVKNFCTEFETSAAEISDLSSADAVVLGFKPQGFKAACEQYAPYMRENTLVISIMAGTSIADIAEGFKTNRVARTMPNLGLAVGKGATGYAMSENATENDAKLTEDMFSASGICVRVEEDKINDVGALSGSGAAYLCLMLEILVKTAVEDGLDETLARALAKQTLYGAAEVLEKQGMEAEVLRDKITSKKGATDAAVRAMQDSGIDTAVANGYRANKRRCEQLAVGG